ncbi:Demethylmenaquinone methyltransferase [Choanephora cucurbitarum]|uniref:Demethylmenaquinone methyltransferase n=1 Tax=Choanephora cucurbitarum TaxID=101091 RepID=A0A1C7NHY1_9FUNG|nr:Demethylmenaquinone methyltransferase [Choanephora cucurbitarum]
MVNTISTTNTLRKNNNVGNLILQGCKKRTQKIQLKRSMASNEEDLSKKTNTVKSKHLRTHPSTKSLYRSFADSGFSNLNSTIPLPSFPIMDEMLPRTEQELDHMVSQHYILRTAFGSDFSAPVSSFDKKVVLDMGCGTGTWTMEMATRFPNATFIGLDKSSDFPRDIKPKNCYFERFYIDPTEIRLPFKDQSVDYIFQRDLNCGLPRAAWLPLMDEYYRILKPGGWLELMEPDVETQSSSSYEDFLLNKLICAFYNRQQDPFVAKRLSSLMAESGFRRIQSNFQCIPLGWGYDKISASQQLQLNTKNPVRCSEYARAACCHRLEQLKSIQPWFTRENNIEESKYQTYIQQLPTEWFHSKSYINWHRATAQKPYYVGDF